MKKISTIALLIFMIDSVIAFAGFNKYKNFVDSNTTITSVADNGKCIWIGTDKGLIKICKNSKKKTIMTTANSILPCNHITAVCATTNGEVWIGTKQGLVRYDNFSYMNVTSENSKLADDRITSLYADNHDNIWIGTLVGLVRMKNNFQDYKIFTIENSLLKNNSIVSISGDKYNNIWIGVYGNGLVKIENENWKLYNAENSELDAKDVLFVSLENDGKYYIGTHESGMYTYDGVGFTKVLAKMVCNFGSCKVFSNAGKSVYSFQNNLWTKDEEKSNNFSQVEFKENMMEALVEKLLAAK